MGFVGVFVGRFDSSCRRHIKDDFDHNNYKLLKLSADMVQQKHDKGFTLSLDEIARDMGLDNGFKHYDDGNTFSGDFRPIVFDPDSSFSINVEYCGNNVWGVNVCGTVLYGNEPEAPKNAREKILKDTIKCVCGQREQDYGTPEDTFGRIADLWSAYLKKDISTVDVSMMMALMKIARIQNGGTEDSFVDLAGYAACGGEIYMNNKEVSDNE